MNIQRRLESLVFSPTIDPNDMDEKVVGVVFSQRCLCLPTDTQSTAPPKRVQTLMIPVAFAVMFLSLFLIHSRVVYAQSTPAPATPAVNPAIVNLQSQISQRTDDIKKLEKEIASYQKQLDELGTQASSLSSTIKGLQLSQKKLETDIKVTESKIAEKNLVIQQLGSQISDKEDNIVDNTRIISRSFATMNEIDTKSLPELLLAKNSLSQVWNSIDEIGTLQKGLSDNIGQLKGAKANLEANKKATEKAKSELQVLGRQLNDQKKIVADTTKENNALLKETKNNQASYTQLLTERQKQKEAFEREVDALESALKITIDPSSIPTPGTGIFSYPLDIVRITQYFGNTAFAAKNPQAYKGSSGEHNGVDFAASIGTPVKAASSGIVSHVINTTSRLKCGYGNWVSIKHPNGLTTLYAHLSLNTTSVGSSVVAGQIIGYSGNTGYTTGPHLHFGLYATQGLQVTDSRSCPGITIPYAALNAYLNPLSYM